jgi:hypothetical protein
VTAPSPPSSVAPPAPAPPRPLSRRQRALIALADELTPAKSIGRLDAATARVVTTVSVVGTVLTGFGLLTAGLPATEGGSRILAVASVVLAFLAVLCALSAQILTITRRLNTNNLKEVERWYLRRFLVRAPLARAASVLLVLATAAAGVAAVMLITGDKPDRATFAVTRTAELPAPSASGAPAPDAVDTVTVEVAFREVDAGQVATITVSVDGRVVAQAAVTPSQDGVVSRTLTVAHVPAAATVIVSAEVGRAKCTAEGRTGQPLRVNCSAP